MALAYVVVLVMLSLSVLAVAGLITGVLDRDVKLALSSAIGLVVGLAAVVLVGALP